MSVTFPTLDLGELGDRIDAALQDADLDVVEAAAPEEAADPATPDANETEQPVADPEGQPAADAEDPDFEAKYQERFARDYLEKSQQDIRKLQKRLDPQIAEQRTRAETAAADHQDAEDFAAFLLQQLAEYDPDQARSFQARRQSLRAADAKERELKALKRDSISQRRSQWYAANHPDIDPDDGELRDAYERGDEALEKRLLALKVREAALNKAPKPAARPTPAAKVGNTPARDANGQFVAQRVAATRAAEQARGHETLKPGGAAPTVAPTSIAEARTAFQAGLARLGVS